MSEYAVLPLSDYTEACEAAREMTGTSDKITSGQLAGKIRSISKGENLDDELENQDDLIEDIMAALQGKAAGDGSGADPVIRALNVTENGTYEAPAGVDGYSPVVVNVATQEAPAPVLQSKTVSPTTSKQTVKPDSGYDGLSQVEVNAMPTATQATPAITVSASGLITASATQSAGYVSAGTKSATQQLPTKGATTITPGASAQTAVSAGTYVTGDIKVAAVSGSGGGDGNTEELQWCVLSNYYLDDPELPASAVIYFRPGWTWTEFVNSVQNKHIPGHVTSFGGDYRYVPYSAEPQPVALLAAKSGEVCFAGNDDFFLVSNWDETTFALPSDAMIPGHTYHWD